MGIRREEEMEMSEDESEENPNKKIKMNDSGTRRFHTKTLKLPELKSQQHVSPLYKEGYLVEIHPAELVV